MKKKCSAVARARFRAMERVVASGGALDLGADAAALDRKRYGAKRFAAMAKVGRQT